MLAILISIWVEVNVGRYLVKDAWNLSRGFERTPWIFQKPRGTDLQLCQHDLPKFIQWETEAQSGKLRGAQ